jgi:hypothetical protein
VKACWQTTQERLPSGTRHPGLTASHCGEIAFFQTDLCSDAWYGFCALDRMAVARSGPTCPLLRGWVAWDHREPASRSAPTRKAPMMESTRSEEPREAGEPEEPFHEARVEPSPQESAARPAPMAEGEQRQAEQVQPRTQGGVFQERLRRLAHQILGKSERKS